MKFSQKLRQLRRHQGITQADAAKGCNVSLRTYKGYELDERLPRFRKIYVDIANFYGVDLNYLLTDGVDFVLAAQEEFGNDGARGARLLVRNAQGLFAGGTLSEEDMDSVFFTLTEAYMEAKRENRRQQKQKKEVL